LSRFHGEGFDLLELVDRFQHGPAGRSLVIGGVVATVTPHPIGQWGQVAQPETETGAQQDARQ